VLLLAAKEGVCKDAFQSCDEAALFKEKITGDDVAGVRLSATEGVQGSENQGE
jgi:hypothetical protein